MRRPGVLLLLIPIAAAAISLESLAPPSSDSIDFSTARAMEHLRFLAREPRPVGSPHHREVRESLEAQLSALGFEVAEHTAKAGTVPWLKLTVINVLARRPGTDVNGKTILLAAHYDSTEIAPGAGDDGAATAALLEVARNLAQHLTRNPILLVISDGEEKGLLGARALVTASHPWLNNIGVVLNFEARGTSGPSIMFETSASSAWLIDAYARTVNHPICSSLSYDIYKLLPNNTDFTVYRDGAGLEGLNFAFINGYTNYHRKTDDMAHIDERCVRHHGEQALALARIFGDIDFAGRHGAGSSVYFSVLGRWVARYPEWLIVPLACAAALLAGISSWSVGRPLRVLGSVGMLLLTCTVAFGIAWGVVWLARRVGWDAHVDAALASICAAGALMVFGGLDWKADRTINVLAGVLVLIAGSIATIFIFRGGSYLVVWPATLGSVALLTRNTKLGTAFAIVASVGTVLIAAPILYLAFIAMRLPLAPFVSIAMTLFIWNVFAPLMRDARHSAVSDGGGPASSISPASEAPSKSIRK